MSIITDSYVTGINGKNLVLNTFGKIYVKVRDSYYELDFRSKIPETNIIFTDDPNNITYPGDNKLIVSNGDLFYTKDGTINTFNSNCEELSDTAESVVVNNQVQLDSSSTFSLTNTQISEEINASYLNGIKSEEFTIKSNNEIITGTWKFNNIEVSGEIIGNNTLIDFINSSIDIDFINVRKKINYNSIESNMVNLLTGETILGKEINLTTIIGEVNFKYKPHLTVKVASDMFYLPDLISIQNWYFIFFTNYSSGIETSSSWVPIIRNLELQSEKDYVNNFIQSLGKDYNINDYMRVFYNFYLDEVDMKCILISTSNLQYNTLNCNSTVIDNNGIFNGTIAFFTNDSIWIKINTYKSELTSTSKLFIDYNHYLKCGISFNSINKYIDIKLNSNSRIGNLQQLSDDIFGVFNKSGVFLNGGKILTKSPLNKVEILDYFNNHNSDVFIKNPSISFNNSSIFNSDGSGYIANGKLIWNENGINLNVNTLINISENEGSLANGKLTWNENEITNLEVTMKPLTIIKDGISYIYDGSKPITIN